MSDPAFSTICREGTDQLAKNAAADRASDGVAQCAERILLGHGARRVRRTRQRAER